MNALLDIGLVALIVAAAVVYLVRRKLKSSRKITRDWSTGHSEACDSCPLIRSRSSPRE